MTDRFDQLRLIEALLFASAAPLDRERIARHLPDDADLDGLMAELTGLYANRGVHVVRVGERWALRTAPDVGPLLQIETTVVRKPSRAAIETLAIIAYHQPVTRAEIEEIRGVALSRGTLDTLLEAGWIRPRGRRRTPGRPVTWGTTETFLDHFGLESLDSLPGTTELKAAGLLDTRLAATVLHTRGELLDLTEAGEDRAAPGDEEPEDGDEAEEPLAADFGEHLVALDDGDDEPAEVAPVEDPENGAGDGNPGGHAMAPKAAMGAAEAGEGGDQS